MTPDTPRPCDPKRQLDLAIDAAVHRIVLSMFPDLQGCDIQNLGSIKIVAGRYTVSFHGRPVALIELESDDRFRLTVL